MATIVKAFLFRSAEADPALVSWLSGDGKVINTAKARPQPATPLVTEEVRAARGSCTGGRRCASCARVLRSARDAMIVRWLVDSGIRVGGMCGLRFSDLHLVRDHPCGQRRRPSYSRIVGRGQSQRRTSQAYYASRVGRDGWLRDRRGDPCRERRDGDDVYSYLLDGTTRFST